MGSSHLCCAVWNFFHLLGNLFSVCTTSSLHPLMVLSLKREQQSDGSSLFHQTSVPTYFVYQLPLSDSPVYMSYNAAEPAACFLHSG